MAPSLSFFVSIPLMIVVGKKTCTSSSLVAKKWQHKCSLAVFLNLCPSPNYIKVVNCLLYFNGKLNRESTRLSQSKVRYAKKQRLTNQSESSGMSNG